MIYISNIENIDKKRWITVQQAAKERGVTTVAMYKLIRNHGLRTRKGPRCKLVSRKSLMALNEFVPKRKYHKNEENVELINVIETCKKALYRLHKGDINSAKEILQGIVGEREV